MSYQSKRTIASIIAGLLLAAAYVAYALSERAPAPDNLKSWAAVMLIFIGIGVAAVIIVQIVFHIAFAIGAAAKEQDHDGKKIERILSSFMVEDEREKLISLKSAHVGYIGRVRCRCYRRGNCRRVLLRKGCPQWLKSCSSQTTSGGFDSLQMK